MSLPNKFFRFYYKEDGADKTAIGFGTLKDADFQILMEQFDRFEEIEDWSSIQGCESFCIREDLMVLNQELDDE